jgi:8-hydroxy-5-deazaflavin:NADPH oxidoreductase
MQIAIIGAGNVGGALGQGWARTGHAITYGVPDPSEARHRATAQTAGGARLLPVPQAVQGADAIVLAVPFDAVGDALKAAGDLTGRLLIDVTNPLRMGAAGLELSIGFDRSAAERVASLTPGAAVFKTLNQVGFEVMESTAGYVAPPVMFVAGDDATRKPVVMALVSDLGFHAVDAGGLCVARLLEPYGILWIHMAINRKAGRDNAFPYLARGTGPAGSDRGST